MALKGTLKDFGIADILQLIGQQGKTGVLHLRNRDQEVHVAFHEGAVVKADSQTRNKKDLLGAMLMRAEVITEPQLEESLRQQKNTLKRLGDILVSSGALTRKDLKEFTKLQTTETIYKLFLWVSGTYEFEQQDVTWDKETMEPLRAESLLMEGFRAIDEWPLIRKHITGYNLTFEIAQPLPVSQAAAPKPAADDDFGGLDDAFDSMGSSSKSSSKDDKLGTNERRVYGLVRAERDVQKLIDLSRLGEFETCKALLNLLDGGYVKTGAVRARASKDDRLSGGLSPRRMAWMRTLTRAAVYSAGIVAVGGVLVILRVNPLELSAGTSSRTLTATGLLTPIAETQLARMRNVLEIYRIETGLYPDTLDQLVEAELLEPRELTYPWKQPYHYARAGESFVLLPPLP